MRERFGTRIVEDAAESLGAAWTKGACAGQQVGAIGDIGCFSFNGNKIITTGGGGMITTDDSQVAIAAKHLTNQAKAADGQYLHDTIGYNYRLSNVAAALGVAQLERLPDTVRSKRRLAERYTEGLLSLPITSAPDSEWARPTFWLYSLLLDRGTKAPADLVAAMAEHGVQVRQLWPPLHQQRPYVATERIGGAVTEDLHQRGLSLPSSPRLSAQQQDVVMRTITTLFMEHASTGG
jgi:dTDP-4-amino-4,6-dideoxygalactose transaminase